MIHSDQNRNMTDLLFNYNLSDITPKEPLLLGGFANRKGLSGEVHIFALRDRDGVRPVVAEESMLLHNPVTVLQDGATASAAEAFIFGPHRQSAGPIWAAHQLR